MDSATEDDKTISDYIASSKSYSQTDDALKDEDNAAWIMQLPDDEIKNWITVLHWVRLADRLLERERLQADNPKTFTKFVEDWKKLRLGENFEDSEHPVLFTKLKALWENENLTEEDLKIWDLYLESLQKYTRPGVVIKDMEEYEKALYGLSGTFFHAFPAGPREGYKKEIGVLGTLDQFYNNLRDLYEDSARGVYYFPETLLQKFGIERHELAKLAAEPDERFVKMSEFMLASFAAKLKAEVATILAAELPHSWRMMIKNNFRRYGRIEHVFRLSNHNARIFSTQYWDHVREEMNPEIRAKFRSFKSTLKI